MDWLWQENPFTSQPSQTFWVGWLEWSMGRPSAGICVWTGLVPGSSRASLALRFAAASLVPGSWSLGPWGSAYFYDLLGLVWNLGLIGWAWSLVPQVWTWTMGPGTCVHEDQSDSMIYRGWSGAWVHGRRPRAWVCKSGPRHWVSRCQPGIEADLELESSEAGLSQSIFWFHL